MVETVCRAPAKGLSRWSARTLAGVAIAGDDDRGTETNPGREKAVAVAEAVAGVAIFPNFGAEQRAQGLTDFNDLGIQNPELVSRQLEEILQGVREQRLVGIQSIELARAV